MGVVLAICVAEPHKKPFAPLGWYEGLDCVKRFCPNLFNAGEDARNGEDRVTTLIDDHSIPLRVCLFE